MKNIFSKVVLTGLVLLISQLTVAQISETTEESNPFSGSSSSGQTAATDIDIVARCSNCESVTSTKIIVKEGVNPNISFDVTMNYSGGAGYLTIYEKDSAGQAFDSRIGNDQYVPVNGGYHYTTLNDGQFNGFEGDIYVVFETTSGLKRYSNVYKVEIEEEEEEEEEVEEEEQTPSSGGSSGSSGYFEVISGTSQELDTYNGVEGRYLESEFVIKFNNGSLYLGQTVEVKFQLRIQTSPGIRKTEQEVSLDNYIINENEREVTFSTVYALGNDYEEGTYLYVPYLILHNIQRSATTTISRDTLTVKVTESDIEEKLNSHNQISASESFFEGYPTFQYVSDYQEYESTLGAKGINYVWQKKTELNPNWVNTYDTGILGGRVWGTSDLTTKGTYHFNTSHGEGDVEYRRILTSSDGVISVSNVVKVEGYTISSSDNLVIANEIEYEAFDEFLGGNKLVDASLQFANESINYFITWQRYTDSLGWSNISGQYVGIYENDNKDYIPIETTSEVKYRRVVAASIFINGSLISQSSYSNELAVSLTPQDELFSEDFDDSVRRVTINTNFPRNAQVNVSYNQFMSTETKINGFNGAVNSGAQTITFIIPQSYFGDIKFKPINLWVEIDGRRTLWGLISYNTYN